MATEPKRLPEHIRNTHDMADQIAYLTIHNAHNGESLKVPKPVRFHTFASLKTYLVEHFTNYVMGSVDNVFLLTSFGIKLNFQMINEMSDIYVFDKRLFNSTSDPNLLQRYLQHTEDSNHTLLKPKPFSGSGTPGDNINRLSSNLKMFDGWSKALLQSCHQMDEHIERCIKQVNAIFKSLNIIFLFAANFITGIEKNFNSYHNYIKLLSMKSLHKAWENYYSALMKFPKFRLKHQPTNSVSLCDYLNVESLQSSAKYVAKYLPHIVDKFNTFTNTINSMNEEKIGIDDTIEVLRKESITRFKTYEDEKKVLMVDIEQLSKGINDEIQSLSQGSTLDLRRVSEKQSDVAPELYEYSSRLYLFLSSLFDFKQKLVNDSLEIFETVATLQMKMVLMKIEMKTLMNPQDDLSTVSKENSEGDIINHDTVTKIKEAEDLLSMTVDLPLLYGFILIEKRRQFEWHDFYSKGIVNNVSEQLTMIIDHEKVFQKLWLRKFGGFIKLLSPNGSVRIQLPTIDVTLVNGGVSNREDALFNLLSNVDIEREDITNYILMVREHQSLNSTKFATILDKNLKDLVASTESMKRVTKVVSTLSSFTSPSNSEENNKLKILKNGKVESVDEDAELNLIKGLRSRIKKLEDLLHQQQYKNLSNWPVVRSFGNKPGDDRSSLILGNDFQQGETPSRKPSLTDPTKLLQRRHTTVPRMTEDHMATTKVLDASVTIDKHLDNIRLRKENSELASVNKELIKVKVENQESLESMTEELERRQQLITSSRKDHEERFAIAQETIQSLGVRHENELLNLRSSKDNEIEELRRSNESLEAKLREMEKKFESTSQDSEKARTLDERLQKAVSETNDMRTINSELLSNMHAKEAEFSNERKCLEDEIKKLTAIVDEKTDDYETLMEIMQGKQHNMDSVISKLNKLVEGLFDNVSDLISSNFDYFQEFCYVLESMGLLLVKEADGNLEKPEFRIRRVKGLKSKRDDADDMSMITESKIHSTVVQEIMQSMEWIETIKRDVEHIDTTGNSETENHEEEAVRLIEIYEKFFGQNGKFGQFLRLIGFKEDIQLQLQESESAIVNLRFFLNGIAKRFKDVEGFAKKLTKENKLKNVEVARLIKASTNKISVNNFQEGDLVLFLPTQIDDSDAVSPWTAFNIDAPHYFLNSSTDMRSKEWIVSRIASISEHTVTAENADCEANPFQLSVGVTWYMIQVTG